MNVLAIFDDAKERARGGAVWEPPELRRWLKRVWLKPEAVPSAGADTKGLHFKGRLPNGA